MVRINQARKRLGSFLIISIPRGPNVSFYVFFLPLHYMGLQMCPFNASFELLLDLRNIRVVLRGSALPAEHRAAPQDEYRSGVPFQTTGEPVPTLLSCMR